MPSIGLALSRAYWSKGAWNLLVTLCLCAIFWPLFMLRLFGILNIGDELAAFFYAMMFMETLAGVLQIGVIVSDLTPRRAGFPLGYYVLPVTTARLVFWQMLLGIATIACFHLTIVGVVFLRGGTVLPILKPFLFLAALFSCAMAVVWSLPDLRFFRLFAIMLLAVPFSLGLISKAWYSAWQTPTMLLPIVIAAAYAVAVVGVARDRRGAAQGVPTFTNSRVGAFDRSPQRHKGFSSPASAQFWFEWRQKGWVIPACVAVAIGIVSVAELLQSVVFGGKGPSTRAFTWGTIPWFLEVLVVTLVQLSSFTLPILAFIGGIYMVRKDSSAGAVGLNSFRATRPLSDHSLVAASLKVGGLSIFLGWAIGVIALSLALLGFVLCDGTNELTYLWYNYTDYDHTRFGPWLYPVRALASLVISWILLSTMIVLGATGWPKIMSNCLGVVCGLIFTGIMIHLLVPSIPPVVWEAVARVTLNVVGASLILGTWAGIVTTFLRGLVSRGVFWGSIAAWVAVVILGYSVLSGIKHRGMIDPTVLWIGALTLAAATPALATLAIAWNRHR